MSKLEDQLKESRRKERPDLRPPEGGWAAVQAGLAAGTTAAVTTAAAGEAAAAKGTTAGVATTAAATVAKASVLATIVKAVTGIAVAGALAAGGYYYGVRQQAAATPPQETLSTHAGADGQRGGTSAVAPMNADAGQISDARPELSAPATPAGHGTGAESEAEAGSATAQFPPRRDDRQTAAAGHSQQNNQSPTPTRKETDPAGRTPAAPVNPAGPASSDGTIQNSQLPEGASAADTTGNVYAATEEGAADAQAGGDPEPAVNRMESNAVAKLSAEPLTEVDFAFSRSPLALEEEVIADGADYNFKKAPGPTGWFLHGGVSSLVSRQNRISSRTSVLERSPGTPVPSDQFTLPNGELVTTVPGTDLITLSLRESSINYRVGYTRQTHWGGALRGSLNHYRYRSEYVFDRAQITEGQVVRFGSAKENSTFMDIGFQYTLLRRHRFRPFAGIGTLLSDFGSEKRVINFFDADTGFTVETQNFSSSTSAATQVDLTITAGFQYDVSSRLSLGLNVWYNNGSGIYVDAPYGIEARYRLH